MVNAGGFRFFDEFLLMCEEVLSCCKKMIKKEVIGCLDVVLPLISISGALCEIRWLIKDAIRKFL